MVTSVHVHVHYVGLLLVTEYDNAQYNDDGDAAANKLQVLHVTTNHSRTDPDDSDSDEPADVPTIPPGKQLPQCI